MNTSKLNVGMIIHGYKGVCRLLEEEIRTSKVAKQSHMKEMRRFFDFKIMEQNKWHIVEIFETPKPKINQKNNISGIYQIKCNKNNKVYIGESNDIHRRWEEHKTMLQDKSHHSYKLQNDYDIYGMGNFEFTIVEVIKDEVVSDYVLAMKRIIREGYYIDMYDTMNNGYNVEHTLNEILNGNKFRMSHKLDLQTIHNLMKMDNYTEEEKLMIKNKKQGMLKETKSKKTSIKNNIDAESVSGIYSITNVITNKRYIVYNDNIQTSISLNKKRLLSGKFIPYEVQLDWNKYSEEAFKFEILEQLSNQSIEYLKTKYICESVDSYNNISNRSKFEYSLLKQLDSNGYGWKVNYKQLIHDNKEIIFDIAVLNDNQELQGFIIIDENFDTEVYKNSIQQKIKHCEDNSIGYKVMKVKG